MQQKSWVKLLRPAIGSFSGIRSGRGGQTAVWTDRSGSGGTRWWAVVSRACCKC